MKQHIMAHKTIVKTKEAPFVKMEKSLLPKKEMGRRK